MPPNFRPPGCELPGSERNVVNNRFKTLLAMFGFYLFLILVGDAALRLLFLAKDTVKPENAAGTNEPRAYLAAYEGADFDPVAMWGEIKRGTDQWLNYQPYTVWTRKPIVGQYINVDDQGYRVTKFNSDAPDAMRIWLIGGSTTWGMGVPDLHPIASQLSRLFNEWGVQTRVLNLGHTGFVSTQEVVTLIRELQTREAPDVFVVYDGLNEGLGLAGRPDLPNPHYLINRVSDLFESRSTEPAPGTPSLIMEVAKTTGYFRLATSLRTRFLPGQARENVAGSRKEFINDADIASVAERSAGILLENYQLMNALGEGYGFPCFFFFQPQPGVGDKPLHESEIKVLAKVADDPEEKWVLDFSREQRTAFRRRLAAGQGPEQVVDLSDMFAGVTRPLYLDWAHLSPAGNRLVAERIFDIICEQLCAGGSLTGRNGQAADQVAAACGNGSVQQEEH